MVVAVAVVVIVAVVFVVLVAVGIFLELVGTSGAEFENFLLEVPCAARVVRGSGYHGLINIFGAIVKIALQMTAVPGDEREIVGLHPLRSGISDLVSVFVNGKIVDVNTAAVTRESSSRTSRSGKVIGGTAALGAIIGALAGGGKGAAIGAASGAGVGTAAR